MMQRAYQGYDISGILQPIACTDYIAGVPNIAIYGGTFVVGQFLLKGKGIGSILSLVGLGLTAATAYAKYMSNVCSGG